MSAISEMSNLTKYPGGVVPFMTIYPFLGNLSELEITNSKGSPKIVHAELDDPIYSTKNTDIDVEKLLVLKREGFNDVEMSEILNIIRDNKTKIIENDGSWLNA